MGKGPMPGGGLVALSFGWGPSSPEAPGLCKRFACSQTPLPQIPANAQFPHLPKCSSARSLSLELPKLKPVRSAVGTARELLSLWQEPTVAPSPFLLLETAVPIGRAPPPPAEAPSQHSQGKQDPAAFRLFQGCRLGIGRTQASPQQQPRL